MQNEVNRYKTFISNNWKYQELVKPLVESGFFYTNKEDITKCAFCGIEIKNWSLELNPEALHKKMSKYCERYLEYNFSQYNQRLKTFERWNLKNIQKEKLAESGFIFLGYKDATQCFKCKIKLEEWKEDDEPDLVHKSLSKDCEFLKTKNNSKQSLGEKFICNICLENEKNTCFLPCAHVVCCLDCCINVSKSCPVCMTEIKQKIRIFV